MLQTLAAAAAEASDRYRETAELAKGKLDATRQAKAARSRASCGDDLDRSGADARADDSIDDSRMAWLCAMLLSTSEEALRAKHALMKAHEQQMADAHSLLERRAEEARRTAAAAEEEREALRAELGAASAKLRKGNLEARQARTREAARLQAAREENAKLQEAFRLSEASAKEERRAEMAVSAQREKNLQAAVVRLQRELEHEKRAAAAATHECGDLQASLSLREREVTRLDAQLRSLSAEIDEAPRSRLHSTGDEFGEAAHGIAPDRPPRPQLHDAATSPHCVHGACSAGSADGLEQSAGRMSSPHADHVWEQRLAEAEAAATRAQRRCRQLEDAHARNTNAAAAAAAAAEVAQSEANKALAAKAAAEKKWRVTQGKLTRELADAHASLTESERHCAQLEAEASQAVRASEYRLAAANRRCDALEEQCAQGVQLIERLKDKMKSQEDRLSEKATRPRRRSSSPLAMHAPTPVYALPTWTTPETAPNANSQTISGTQNSASADAWTNSQTISGFNASAASHSNAALCAVIAAPAGSAMGDREQAAGSVCGGPSQQRGAFGATSDSRPIPNGACTVSTNGTCGHGRGERCTGAVGIAHGLGAAEAAGAAGAAVACGGDASDVSGTPLGAPVSNGEAAAPANVGTSDVMLRAQKAMQKLRLQFATQQEAMNRTAHVGACAGADAVGTERVPPALNPVDTPVVDAVAKSQVETAEEEACDKAPTTPGGVEGSDAAKMPSPASSCNSLAEVHVGATARAAVGSACVGARDRETGAQRGQECTQERGRERQRKLERESERERELEREQERELEREQEQEKERERERERIEAQRAIDELRRQRDDLERERDHLKRDLAVSARRKEEKKRDEVTRRKRNEERAAAEQWKQAATRAERETMLLAAMLREAETEVAASFAQLRARVRAAEQAARSSGQAMLSALARARAASSPQSNAKDGGAANADTQTTLRAVVDEADVRLIEAEVSAERRYREADIHAKGTIKMLHAALRDAELKHQELTRAFDEQTEQLERALVEKERLQRRHDHRHAEARHEQPARSPSLPSDSELQSPSSVEVLNGGLRAMKGLNRMRTSLLDTLREERLRLEKERASIAERRR